MFSIVIPTHDRLELLKNAVDTVLEQDYSDWELVIFDNASANGLAEYIKEINDSRVRYERSDDFLPVTDSWNRAIDFAQGDYITVIGDDDGLAPGYFTKLNKVISDFNSPEVIYSNIYQFFQHGVAPWCPEGYVADIRNGFFFRDKNLPFLLSAEEALKAVRGSIKLRRNFTYNMQAFCFHRDFLRQLKNDGPIFRSPFPDYYLANVAFAKAHAVVIIPEPISIAGVTKSSFGYTLFNNLEEQGAALLNSEITSDPLFHEIERYLLPGPKYDTNYVITMQHVAKYVKSFAGCNVSFRRYRRLQIYKMLKVKRGCLERNTPAGNIFWSHLSFLEKIWTLGLSAIIRFSDSLNFYETRFLPTLKRLLEPYNFEPVVKMISRGQYSNLIDFFRSLQPPLINSPLASGKISIVDLSKDFATKKNSIAVVYLARMQEGIEPLKKFASSYVRNQPGINHDLVVIYKGYDNGDSINEAKRVFADIAHMTIEISDEGYDINAYVKATRAINHEYVCFLNTFTEIVMPYWLLLLYQHIVSPDVGIAGAMGSYESLNDSVALINKVIWLCNKSKISYNKIVDNYYKFVIDIHCKKWRGDKQSFFYNLQMKRKYVFFLFQKLLAVIIRHNWSEIVALIKYILIRLKLNLNNKKSLRTGSTVNAAFQRKSVDEEYKQLWEFRTGPEGDLKVYSQFPPFPNPHIRTNCFIIKRQRFIKLNSLEIKTKLDACIFESGINSMTKQIWSQGLKAVVVGRSGQGYDMYGWVRSGTFRMGQQENLLCMDNQSRQFDAMSQGTKSTHARMTWGDYLEPAPADFPDFNYKFNVNDNVVCSQYVQRSYITKYSFLIPTKNRLELLRHAIDSILQQNYSNFEIIISDNASEQDYAGFVDKIGDNRIMYKRLTEPVSVTENWRRALERATGDYVLMLGDDDALTPWFLPSISNILNKNGYADIVYSSSYHYCYPNVISVQPSGYLIDVHNSVFLEKCREPFSLPLDEAQRVAKAILDFRYFYGINSQHYLLKKEFLQSLSNIGGIFQSPYPDTFAAVVSFLKAKSIIVVPNSMTIIGISPKSFGYYYFNDLQSKGYEFLDNDHVSVDVQKFLKDVVLDGDKNNTYWMVAAEQARRALAPEFDLSINYERYRTLQMIAFLSKIYLKGICPESEIDPFVSNLSSVERIRFDEMHAMVAAAKSKSNESIIEFFEAKEREMSQFIPAKLVRLDIGNHSNIGDAFNALSLMVREGRLVNGHGISSTTTKNIDI